jgi:hypothetical protein
MYLSDEMADKIVEKMEDKEPTARMLKVAMSFAEERGVELTEDQKESFIDIRKFLNDTYLVIDGKETQPPHRMDDFAEIVKAMGTTQFKKSTFDFEVLDEKHINTYKDVKTNIVDMHKNPEQHKIPNPDFTGNEPVLVTNEEVKKAIKVIVDKSKKTKARKEKNKEKEKDIITK